MLTLLEARRLHLSLEGALGQLLLLAHQLPPDGLDALAQGLTPCPTLRIPLRLALAAAGTMVPFATRRAADGRVLGMTTFLNIDPSVPRAEIGSTWLAASAQRTGVNTEAKLLMLTHAFEVWGCARVEFRTHALNTQSRRAIERTGGQLEGILRQHMRLPNGLLRDTAQYAILDHQWPTVRVHLRALLDAHA